MPLFGGAEKNVQEGYTGWKVKKAFFKEVGILG